jgi:hypothetical protein
VTRRLLVVALAVVAAATVASCGKRDEPQAFGREVVATARMPRDVVAKFNAFVPEPRKPGESAIDALASDTEVWRAPVRVDVVPAGNPYVIAIHAAGRVTGDAGAVTLWLAGFERKPDDGPYRQLWPVAGLNAPKEGTRGDGSFARAAASRPVSFRDAETVVPVVEIQRRSGVVLEEVSIEVWSGLPATTWREMLFGWQGALVGLFMLVFWWFLLRKRD